MSKPVVTPASLRKRLRSLARALRPFEREADSIINDCNAGLDAIDERVGDIYSSLSPSNQKKFSSFTGISELADDIYYDLQQLREEIAMALRPESASSGERRRSRY